MSTGHDAKILVNPNHHQFREEEDAIRILAFRVRSKGAFWPGDWHKGQRDDDSKMMEDVNKITSSKQQEEDDFVQQQQDASGATVLKTSGGGATSVQAEGVAGGPDEGAASVRAGEWPVIQTTARPYRSVLDVHKRGDMG
ncbi:salicylyl-CoA 5-hydroxylase [Sesbania bispinosa]|nr:salicylyl-CoA 5-hydroxylase [Sesbania bispinosa]